MPMASQEQHKSEIQLAAACQQMPILRKRFSNFELAFWVSNLATLGQIICKDYLVTFVKSLFCVRLKFLLKTDILWKHIILFLSYVLILFRHQLKNVSGKIIYIDYIV